MIARLLLAFGGMAGLIALVAAILSLAGCATVPLPPTIPSAQCDSRMVDHDRRACEQRGFDFLEPSPGTPSCGACIRAVPMPSNR